MTRKFWYYISILIVFIFIILIFIKIHNKKSGNDIDGYNTVTDIDGNVYTTVSIGNQIWLNEDLKTTRFNDSTSILSVKENMSWAELKSPAYCWYDNDSLNNSTGALYNWYTVKSGKLCPTGWHIPSDSEWTTLINYLGGDSIAGEKFQETHTSIWGKKSKTNNTTSFNVVFAGFRYIDGICYDKGRNATWWSSTEVSPEKALSRLISYGGTYIYRINYYSKSHGFSVRCIKDSVGLQ
jgi:uncharacterized protein (TIGR02145 family)